MPETSKIEKKKNIFLVIGSAAGVYSFIRLLLQDLRSIFTKPKLIIEFNPQTDLQIWRVGAPYLQIEKKRKVATVHIRNAKTNDAKECEAFLQVLGKGDVVGKTFPLHWADTPYNALSTSIERITIGGLPRRLDVLFTEEGQQVPGCSVAAAKALAMGPQLDQFLLTQGEYKIRVSVRCSNGKGTTKSFIVKPPDKWENLMMELA